MSTTAVLIVIIVLLLAALAATGRVVRRQARQLEEARTAPAPVYVRQVQPARVPPAPPPPQPLPSPKPAQPLRPVPYVTSTSGSRPAVEPPGLPQSHDTTADSAVDGARLESIVVRAASVRGDRGRRDLTSRAETHLVRAMGQEYGKHILVSIIAAGRSPEVAQESADQVCRSLMTHLSRHLTALHQAWRSDAATDVRQVLLAACHGAVNPLMELAKRRNVAPQSVGVEVICLLTDLTADPERGKSAGGHRHLAFSIGGGTLFRRTGSAWGQIPLNGPESSALTASAAPVSIGISEVSTQSDDILVLTGRTAAKCFTNPEASAYFAEEWAKGPRDLTEFLWQFSARTPVTADDRTAVCVWDFARRA